jgi:CelD/BcsL family acetyltransferase involved in cellulose biosynthesis
MRPQLEIIDSYAAGAEAIWRDLEHTACPTYFLTWGWIENWLAMLPRGEAPALAVIREAGELVGAFFLSRCLLSSYHALPSRAVFINATGVPSRDGLCIEHNGVLGSGGPLASLIELLPDDWDELLLPGIDRETFCDLHVPRGYHVRISTTRRLPFVNLESVRAAGDYLTVVSENTRSQLRRASRRVGACELEVAASLGDALAIYDELVALHTARSGERGEPGAFADPWFDGFHRRLIEQRFAHGEIQLARLRSGAMTIGCLYNLVAGGRVLSYQSGFAPFADLVIRPGLLCHAAAIAYCADAGHKAYDLLGGNAHHKTSLATGVTQLVWLCVQRAQPRLETRAPEPDPVRRGLAPRGARADQAR